MNVDKFNGVRGIMVCEAPGWAEEVVIMISGAPHQTPDARSCPTHAAPPAIFTGMEIDNGHKSNDIIETEVLDYK